MDTKQYITLTIALAVAVVLVSGFMVPVISSLSDSGGGGSGGGEVIVTNLDRPVWTIPDGNTDFDMYFSVSYEEVDGEYDYILSLFSTDPEGQNVSPYFTGFSYGEINYRGTVVVIGDGFTVEVCQYNPDEWALWIFTKEGGVMLDSIHIDGTTLIVTDGEENVIEYPNVYGYIGRDPTHILTYGFYNLEGEYSDPHLPPYVIDSTVFTSIFGLGDGLWCISHGTLDNLESSLMCDWWDESPPGFSNESFEINYYMVEEEDALRFNQMTYEVSLDVEGYGLVTYSSDDTQFESTDGKLDLVYDFDTSEYDTINVNFLVPAEIIAESGSGSGGSGTTLSPTLSSLLSVIPLITVVGIIIGAVAFIRTKN